MHLAAASGRCLTLSISPKCFSCLTEVAGNRMSFPSWQCYHQPRGEGLRCRARGPSGASADSNDRCVFDKFPGRPCSFEEAKEARDACTILDGKAREDCYSSFGCDGNRVEQYLDTVVDLEAHLPKGPDLPGLIRKCLTQMLMVFGLSVLMLLELAWNVGSSMVMSLRAITIIVLDTLRSPWAPSDSDEEQEGKLYTFDAETREFKEVHGHKSDRQSENGPPLPSSH